MSETREEDETISARVVRLNQLLLGKSSTASGCQKHLSRETLLDALLVLYEECQRDSVKKDRNAAVFIEKFRTAISNLRKLRVNVTDFEVKKVIGRGHFGDVQVVREKQSGNVYAMKILRKSEMLSQQNVAFYDEERDIMAKANNLWITKLQYAFQDSINLYLVMDFHPGGDLLCLLDRYDNTFTEDMTRFYLAEMILAIHSLHGMGYVHRDIKPDNVLVDRTGHIKLADFGSAAKLSQYDTVSSKMPVGTPDYIAPEVLSSMEGRKGSYGRSCDWWSLGICAYEMLFGRTPFSGETVVHTYNNIMNFSVMLTIFQEFLNKALRFPDGVTVTENAKDLMRNLFTDVVCRMNFEQLRSHFFFELIDWEGIRDSVPPFVPIVTSQDDTSNFEEFEIVTPTAEIPQLPKQSYFNGRNLPFVGYTYNHAMDYCIEERIGSMSRISASNSEMQIQCKKREIAELQLRFHCLEKRESESQIEVAKLNLKLKEQEKTKLYAECECQRLNKELSIKKAETLSLKSLLDLERTERDTTEKKALKLLQEIQDKWKKSEQKKLEELRKENENLQLFVGELEEKYRITKVLLLTQKEELSSALKMSESAKIKVQHYKDKMRRCSAGDALQMDILQKQLSVTQEQLQDLHDEKRTVENRLESVRNTVDMLEEQVKRLEDVQSETDTRYSETEQRMECELGDVKRELEYAHQEIDKKDAALVASGLLLEELQSKLQGFELQQLNSSYRQAESEDQQNVMRTKFAVKLKELEIELQRVVEENERLQGELLTVKDRDSEKTQTVNELCVIVDRLEEGLKRLDAAKVQSEVADDGETSKEEACESAKEVIFFETRISKLEAQLETCRATLLQEKQESRELRTELFKRERELRDVKIDLRIAKREVKVTSEQLPTLQEKGAQMEDAWKQSTDEVASLRSRLESSAAELETLMKTMETKENDWEREKVRLNERVESLQSTYQELRDVQTKAGEAEGRAQQAEKQIKNMEDQLKRSKEESRRVQRQENVLQSEMKKLKIERDALQTNFNCLKQACATMDEQLNDYESLVRVHEAEEDRLKDEVEVLQKNVASMWDDIKKANEATLVEKSKKEAMEKAMTDHSHKMEMVEVVHDSELQKVLSQRNEYRVMLTELTQKVAVLESELQSVDVELSETQKKSSLLADENVRIKEEAAVLITRIHSLQDTNQKLSNDLKEATDKLTAFKEKVTELENKFIDVNAVHGVEKIRLQETIAQQSKLITFMQLKEKRKKKKTLTEKLFGRVASCSNDQQQSDLASTFKCLASTTDPSLEFGQRRNDLPSPQAKVAISALVKSPGQQQSPDGPVSGERMHHRIPHRFQTGLNLHPTKCAGCLDGIHFGRHEARCQECNICAHPKCASSLPNACGLPLGLMQHFRHSMRQKKSKTSISVQDDVPGQCQLQGWLKIPRSGAAGWEHRFARLEGTSLVLCDQPTALPSDTLELCPSDGTAAKVVEAVSPAEMPTTAKSDLPFIFKVVTQPSTTCWPERCVYLMASGFQEKLDWVASLEKTIKSCSSASSLEEKCLGAVLWVIEDAANVNLNCAIYLDQDCLLVGAEDGLYVVDLLAECNTQHKLRITTFGSIYQMSIVNSLGLLLLITGNDRQLHWMKVADVWSLVRGEVNLMASQLAMLRPVDASSSCHLFVVAEGRDSTHLCVATASRVFLLRWNSGMRNFCVRKELSSREPCSCALFTTDAVIMGTDKFYAVDLQDLVVEEFLDDSDPSLVHVVHGAPQLRSFPMAIFKVSPDGADDEFLLCFYEFGVFVNGFARRSRKEDLRWTRLPLTFAFTLPHLYIVHFNSIEVCDVTADKNKCFAVRTFVDVTSPRYLGPSVESGAVVLAVVSDGRADVLSFIGEVAIRRKALKDNAKSSDDDSGSEFSLSSSIMEALQKEEDDQATESEV